MMTKTGIVTDEARVTAIAFLALRDGFPRAESPDPDDTATDCWNGVRAIARGEWPSLVGEWLRVTADTDGWRDGVVFTVPDPWSGRRVSVQASK